jgi:acetoin utilization protein AcuB
MSTAPCFDPSSLAARDCLLVSLPTITRQTTVLTAQRLLREHDLTALPVVENGRLLGLVHERNLQRLLPSEATTLDVFELRAALDRLTVARLLLPATSVRPDTPLQEVMALMGREALEAVAIVENGCFAGLLTWDRLMTTLSLGLAAA